MVYTVNCRIFAPWSDSWHIVLLQLLCLSEWLQALCREVTCHIRLQKYLRINKNCRPTNHHFIQPVICSYRQEWITSKSGWHIPFSISLTESSLHHWMLFVFNILHRLEIKNSLHAQPCFYWILPINNWTDITCTISGNYLFDTPLLSFIKSYNILQQYSYVV